MTIHCEFSGNFYAEMNAKRIFYIKSDYVIRSNYIFMILKQ